jgi:hypothetical protein
MSPLPAIDPATATGDSKGLPVGAQGGLEKPEGRLGPGNGRVSLQKAVRHGGAPSFREAVQEGVGS